MRLRAVSEKGPNEAYLVLEDGERVPCLIEKIGPSEWQATPARNVHVEEVESAYVDLIPPGHSVDFLLLP